MLRAEEREGTARLLFCSTRKTAQARDVQQTGRICMGVHIVACNMTRFEVHSACITCAKEYPD